MTASIRVRRGQKSKLECVFPVRKKNRRPRRTRQTELLGRLAKLEEMVGRANLPSLVSTGEPPDPHPAAAGQDEGTSTAHVLPAAVEQQQQQQQPDTIGQVTARRGDHAAPSRYLSAEFWTNLCSEVEGLKQTLEQPSDDEADGEGDESATPDSWLVSGHSDESSVSPSAALLGDASSASPPQPDVLAHPPPDRIRYLASMYFSNFDPLLKILHRPTAMAAVDSFIASGRPNHADPAVDALFFSIYFAAATSLPDRLCLAVLGEGRRVVAGRLRRQAELALARADYLDSAASSLTTLQALTIYIACLRSHGASRASWALLGLAIRLAHGLGLHRDGRGAGLPPFEAEMRCRLWWQLVVLDVRCTEDRGSEPLIARDTFNTHLPVNISDDDFGPHHFPPPFPPAPPDLAGDHSRAKPTDVVFSLVTAESSELFLRFCDPQVRFDTASASLSPRPPPPPDEADVHLRIRRLEAVYGDAADPSHLPSVLAARVIQIVVLKLWLTLQYPFRVQPPRLPAAATAATATAARPRVDMLRTALAVMEMWEPPRPHREPSATRGGPTRTCHGIRSPSLWPSCALAPPARWSTAPGPSSTASLRGGATRWPIPRAAPCGGPSRSC